MKKTVVILFSLLISLVGLSQHSQEFGLFLGSSYYIGDLNPTNHFNQNTNPALGLMYKRNHKNLRYSLRLQFLYGLVEGYDHQSDDSYQRNRNLNFRSTILELGAIMEVNFHKFEIGKLEKNYQTPFLFFGLAGYHFKPKGNYKDKWYDLQVMGTEGQNTSANSSGYYKINQIAMPIGIGYKRNVTEDFTFSIEYSARILFTDYLDDVSKKYVNPTVLGNEAGVLSPILADQSGSQIGDRNIGVNRGNSSIRDWYFFAGVTFTYSFGKRKKCDQFDEERK